MIPVDMNEVQRLIESGEDLSRDKILADVKALRGDMRTASTDQISEVLTDIILREQARIISSYKPHLDLANSEAQEELVLELIAEEVKDSCEEFVNILSC